MKKAFTLIEIIAAAAILLVAVSTTAYLFQLSVAMLKTADMREQAALAAISQMEELSLIPAKDIVASSFAEGQGKVNVSMVTPQLKSIEVECLWREGKPPIKFLTQRQL